MPWEDTEDYIRSGHRSISDFQEGSFRTIDIDKAKGIKAVIGRPKGKSTTEVQSYLFEKAKGWTMAKAKAWFAEHEGRGSSARLTLEAAVVQLDAASHEATFYIMNTSKNRNKWGVSSKALAEGAPTIKGKPLGCGKGYKTDDHYLGDENMDVGNFISYDLPSSYMTAKAKIDDDTVWGHLEAKEWGPISVVCDVFEVNCSSCGENIIDSMFKHEHIEDGKAYARVESFKFVRVDFVDSPAYPQAGILDMGASAQELDQAITLVASYFSNGGAPGGLGTGPNPEELRKMTKKTPEELQAELDEKLDKIAELEATVKALKEKPEDKDPEVEELTNRVKALEAQRSQALIDKAAEARFKAGLVEDLEAERTRLAEFPQAYLLALISDAGVLEERLKSTRRRAPKTGYDEVEELTGFDAAFKAAKDRIIPDSVHKMLMAQVAEATEVRS